MTTQNSTKKYVAGLIIGAGLIATSLGIPVYHIIRGDKVQPASHAYTSLALAIIGAPFAGTSMKKLYQSRTKPSTLETN